MKTSTVRKLSHSGAVLLIALAIWVGSYLALKQRGMNGPLLVETSTGQRAQIVWVEVSWDNSGKNADPFADPSNRANAFMIFYKPLIFLDTYFTGDRVIFDSGHL